MKVLLVDDHRLLLEGLQNLLESYGIEVAGLASNGQEAVALTHDIKPDVILMDILMPVCDGLEATRLIKAEDPEARIIILTTSTEDQDLFEAIKSGAYGYLLKNMDSEELVEALDQVQQGVPPFSPGLASRLLDEFARLDKVGKLVCPPNSAQSEAATSGSVLNGRQREVLKLLSEGLSYKEAGTRLGLSPRTIKYHMAEIMRLLHLQNRAQVLAYAGRLGFRSDKEAK